MPDINNKQYILLLCISMFLGFIVVSKTVLPQSSSNNPAISSIPTRKHITITSSAFGNEGTIPVTYTCGAEDKNPPLTISGVTSTTKTLALVVEDPDAPLGPFVHWVVWNIPPDTKDILAGTVPSFSQQGTNSFNHQRYDGPCPPSRHRYYFTVFALDISVGLDGKAKKSDLEKAIKGHVLDQAELIGNFGN